MTSKEDGEEVCLEKNAASQQPPLAPDGDQNSKKDCDNGSQLVTKMDSQACKTKPPQEEKQAAGGATATGKKSKKSSTKTSTPSYSFPKTLQEFKYEFIDGELRHTETQERFVFEVRKGDKDYNQKHYEALGEVITEEVYKLLETQGDLLRITIPVDKKPKDAASFFFASDDAFTNPDKLMILIHGSGVVRAGQWARRLIINDNLDSGTQLPFIERASKEGYGVVVTNTNRNQEEIEGKEKKIKGSKTPEEHAQYIWKHFILKASARNIYIVAHSYGGVVTVELLKAFTDDFQKRVRRIAFTDSVHNVDLHHLKGSSCRWIAGHARNWVTSPEPLDTPFEKPRVLRDAPKVSAGTLKHEETSFFSFESIFRYFAEEDKEI